VPLDFEAKDVSLIMRYRPAGLGEPEFYRIEAGVLDLVLSRELARTKVPPVHGYLQAIFDLERNRLSLRSFRLTARSARAIDRTLEITGALEDFARPHWQAAVAGELDMRLLDPLTGYSDAPEGIAHLSLTAEGRGNTFQLDGGVHIDGGAYVGEGVAARGVTLDAHVHADSRQLAITQVVARLRQGGQIEGSVALEPWLPSATPALREFAATHVAGDRASRNIFIRPLPLVIPVNGKVTANFTGVALDTILDIVSSPQYRRLGFDARLSGPATATWFNGDGDTVSVTAALSLNPSPAKSPVGEVPLNGAIDATYAQKNGSADLRRLELHMPGSEMEVRGTLGAHPIGSRSALSVDFHSRDLTEFDAVLRSLGLKRNGRIGAAALPVALSGQADFHGSWTGSLVKPHLSGTVSAAQLSMEMPWRGVNRSQPQLVRMDSVAAEGSYSETEIAIEHAQMVRGKTRISLSGTLAASPGHSTFDASSVARARIDGADVDIADAEPLLPSPACQHLPVAGVFNARIEADGPLDAPAISGSVEMNSGNLYGEPVSHVQIQGAMADQALKLTSASFIEAGGAITGQGSYDLKSKLFEIEIHGADIDVSRILWLRQHNLEAAGKLRVAITGSGTVEDPRLEASAGISNLSLGGQRFGTFNGSAHIAGRTLAYDVNTQLDAAQFALRGETELSAAYETKARLGFSHFDIGALFAIGHIESFRGQSALEGTATLEGPLSQPEQLHGEARIRELAITIAGVELHGDDGAHATLSNGAIHLDPLHVTGADTDLRAGASLSLKGARQLDLAAHGSINLKLAETVDPDLTGGGVATFQIEAHGPLQHPDLEGRIDFQNASLSLGDLPNGLSQLHGTLEFNRNRLEVKNLTAMTGGGQLSVGGFLAYEHGIYADLSVTGNQVRIRYPQGVTSLADAKLQLRGSENNLLLGGDVLITRFTASPDLDLAALAAQASASMQSVAPPEAPSNHVRLDVHIASSPQLNFKNAFAKLAGDVDLHLRGTLASPSLLGRVSVTEGSATIAGTRYELQRGDVTFTNPVRIEPAIDLSATAHIEDYDISLGLHGPLEKMAITYRSDPPLPEADIVSLLALGHTGNQQRLYTQQQEQAVTNPTDALLGGALNATVSNRVQKLFGAGSVKVDPNYLGAFGNSTSRITVQEQFGRVVTLTYATDVNTTGQQLLQAEVAINRHVSVVVARDESGVFSMVIKATRRYR